MVMVIRQAQDDRKGRGRMLMVMLMLKKGATDRSGVEPQLWAAAGNPHSAPRSEAE